MQTVRQLGITSGHPSPTTPLMRSPSNSNRGSNIRTRSYLCDYAARGGRIAERDVTAEPAIA